MQRTGVGRDFDVGIPYDKDLLFVLVLVSSSHSRCDRQNVDAEMKDLEFYRVK